MVDTIRPCPCCGHLVFDAGEGWPGSFVICPVCYWEDDATQFRRPYTRGGANRVTLAEAQQNFQAFGACEQRSRPYVRPPTEDEPLDADWRPIDPLSDLFETPDNGPFRPWPDDRSVLCWWLPSFWGCPEEPEPDPDRRVVIDVSTAQNERELHDLLKRELGFPSFYGMNWDALWDAISGLVAMPRELSFVGWSAFEGRLPLASHRLRQALTRLERMHPEFKAVYQQ
jgi:RNAse (barnase) inhibitor barstar